MDPITLHSPKGKLILLKDAEEFCKQYNFHLRAFKRILTGEREFYRGWSVYTPSKYNFPTSKNHCN